MQAGFSILTGNRLERLVEHLAAEMDTRPLPPLEKEITIVQSQGMQRWLTLELARLRGLAANLTTPYPQPFIRHLLHQRDEQNRRPPSEPIARLDDSLFSRDLLLWRLVETLGDGEESKLLAAPRSYLADDVDQRKLYQLASRLAALFEQYQLYRGEMLSAWEHHEAAREAGPATWQAALWAELMKSAEGDEPLHRGIAELIRDLDGYQRRPDWLPRRLSVLGVSSLPPVFIDLLLALSRLLPVTIYLLSPTYHYWADLRSEKEKARLERRFNFRGRADRPALGFDHQHFESGHPLLAALGKQGRELFDLLQRADPVGSAWHEMAFEEPAGEGVLQQLQLDVLHLGTAEENKESRRIATEDRSLAIHICHSPMREMQVLHQELLRAFDEIENLRPSDILVLLPDIEGYVPYIQAVFGVAHRGLPDLPFSVADRGAGREQPPSEVVLQILDLASARLTLRDIFDLLETPALRRGAGLTADDVPALRRLLADAGVRWGLSGKHREDLFDVPNDDANTWRMGLDRLLMGYATGRLGDGEDPDTTFVHDPLVAGIAPAAGDTAGDAERLGNFAAFMALLEYRLGELRRRRGLAEWAGVIADLVDDFLIAEDEEEERGLQLVCEAAEQLTRAAERTGASAELSLGLIREHLETQLRLDGFGSGFLNGRITFCALRPMRTIPFRVVAIAGLEAGIFPRRDRRPGFDLMAEQPQQGDRSVRDDDRYLFLETLLATGDRLILSHVGRSQQDGSPRQPSAVLSELIEYLERSFMASDGGSANEQLIRIHPLQPWSAAYFKPGEATHYATEDAAVARALATERQGEPPLLEATLPLAARSLAASSPAATPREVTLEELIRFWQSPSRFFLERTLGIALEKEVERSSDAEPFALRGLEGWPLREWLTERRVRDRAAGRPSDPRAEARELRAQGLLPPGALGAAALRKTWRDVEALLEKIPLHQRQPLFALDVVIRSDIKGDFESENNSESGGWRLTGTLDSLSDLGLLRYRCGQLRPADWLRLWCELLAWSAAQDARHEAAYLIGTDSSWRLSAPESPQAILRSLLAAFELGARRPLSFFGDASWAFAEQEWALADPRRRADRPAIEIARAVFAGSHGPPSSERPPAAVTDSAIRLAFRGRDPLDEIEFGTLASRVWRPILELRREAAG